MTYTELLPHIKATYPEKSNRYHVIATRYYLGAIKPAQLRAMAAPYPVCRDIEMPALLSAADVQTIITNR